MKWRGSGVAALKVEPGELIDWSSVDEAAWRDERQARGYAVDDATSRREGHRDRDPG